jgi:hypothetical protein
MQMVHAYIKRKIETSNKKHLNGHKHFIIFFLGKRKIKIDKKESDTKIGGQKFDSGTTQKAIQRCETDLAKLP